MDYLAATVVTLVLFAFPAFCGGLLVYLVEQEDRKGDSKSE